MLNDNQKLQKEHEYNKKDRLFSFDSIIVCNHTFFTFFVLAQDLLLVVAIILIGFFIVYPSISFVYSKKLLSNGKHRILQSILCPITFALSYVSLLFMEDETYLYALVIFVWCELWSLLGLIKRKKGKEEKVLEK